MYSLQPPQRQYSRLSLACRGLRYNTGVDILVRSAQKIQGLSSLYCYCGQSFAIGIHCTYLEINTVWRLRNVEAELFLVAYAHRLRKARSGFVPVPVQQLRFALYRIHGFLFPVQIISLYKTHNFPGKDNIYFPAHYIQIPVFSTPFHVRVSRCRDVSRLTLVTVALIYTCYHR